MNDEPAAVDRALARSPRWWQRAPQAAAWPPQLVARLGRSVIAWPMAVIAALLALLINEASYRRSIEALAKLEQRAVATVGIQTVMRRLIDAETGLRGYLLTGRRVYLQPYEQAASDAAAGLTQLQSHYGDDAVAAALVAELREQAGAKLTEFARTVEAFDEGRAAEWAAMLEAPDSRRHMDAVAALSEQLARHEQSQIVADREAVFATLHISRLGIGATAALGILALLLLLERTAALEAVQRRHTRMLHDEQARLEADVAQRTADLTELARHLQTVREDEGGRLARDLHEHLGLLLFAARDDIAQLRHTLPQDDPDVTERLEHLDAGLADVIALKRRIIDDLHPTALAERGLVAALELQAREFEARSGLEVATRLDDVALGPAARITAFRLVQESLTNIMKYARARRVDIRLQAAPEPGEALLSVRDDGRGFDPHMATRRGAHGLIGMRYRVEAAGGRLTVHSQPGSGTCIEASLPIVSADAAGAELDATAVAPAGTDRAG